MEKFVCQELPLQIEEEERALPLRNLAPTVAKIGQHAKVISVTFSCTSNQERNATYCNWLHVELCLLNALMQRSVTGKSSKASGFNPANY